MSAFSISKNFRRIITPTDTKANDISSLHGIRFLFTFLIIISHKGMELNFNPIANRTELNIYGQGPISIVFRSIYLYTDVFLMLSGLLVSYSLIGKLQRGAKLNIAKEIAGRYFRFMPAMAALIIFSTFILPQLGNGPQWNSLIVQQAELCKTTSWRNFLMIQNWFGFENICLPNTHHASTDFVLFVFSTFLIAIIHEKPRVGLTTLLVLAGASTIAKFSVIIQRELVVYITPGTT